MGGNFHDIQSAYLIGLKGVGMTALAQILQARGIRVSGSDTAQHFFTDDVLRRVGISCVEGFAAENIPKDVELVIYSTAYDLKHVEVDVAIKRGIPTLTYPEAVGLVFNTGKGIAICGTHGKTTTTAMLGYVLTEAGLDPTVIVGSEIPQFGGNARIGHGEHVVLEADEYQDKLQYYQPYGVILTSIEYDHPDFYPTFEAYVEAFRRFVRRIPVDGFLVACADSPIVMDVSKEARCTVIPYGFTHPPTPPLPAGGGETVKGEANIFSPSMLEGERRVLPKLPESEGGEGVGSLRFQLAGRHNIQNALGVLAAAERLVVSRDVALRALAIFQGAKRRFELVGETNGITVIDDYGHHPTEIRVTLAGAKERYPGRRILCVFHAHTFTRTIALKDEFATAFKDADRTFVMDIFGSAREQHGGITAEELAAMISVYSPAEASGGVDATVATLLRVVQPGDVVICMGAGENDHVAQELVRNK